MYAAEHKLLGRPAAIKLLRPAYSEDEAIVRRRSGWLADPKGTTATQSGSMLGTPLYVAPEQCRSAGRVDARS